MSDHAPLLERIFSLDPPEGSYAIDRIDGEIPDFVRGTYYLNGPARFSLSGQNYRHWLDGDGMVCCLRFAEGRVHFTNKYVRSAKFLAEEEAGQALFRTFGTSFEGDQLKRGLATESPVNVSVYPFADTLLAFGEQGLPWELDPVTLETRGVFDFGGRLNEISPFSAHPKFDGNTGEMFNFGISFSATQPNLNFYRFSPEAELLYRQRYPLDYPCSIHDFGLSADYAVFYLSPLLLDIGAVARQGMSIMEAMSWEPERGSQLLVVDRETGAEVARLPIGSRYCLHLTNCFSAGGRLAVDVLELDRPVYDQYQVIPDLFADVAPGGPVRIWVDLDAGEVVEKEVIDYRQAPDFPAIDPRFWGQEYQELWMLGISATGQSGRKFLDQLVHLDWRRPEARDIYQAPPQHYLGGEPTFIGDPTSEGAGMILCQIFDAEKGESAFALFDAFDVAAGPKALLHLQEPVHLGFHTSFTPA